MEAFRGVEERLNQSFWSASHRRGLGDRKEDVYILKIQSPDGKKRHPLQRYFVVSSLVSNMWRKTGVLGGAKLFIKL
jgi:hypothetical protein